MDASHAPQEVSRIQTYTSTNASFSSGAATNHCCTPTRPLQWPGHKEVLPYWRHMDEDWHKRTSPAVCVPRKRQRWIKVWKTQLRKRWDLKIRNQCSTRALSLSLLTDLTLVVFFKFVYSQSRVDPSPAAWASRWENLSHRLWSLLLRWTALDQKPGQQTDALYLFGQWSQLSRMGCVPEANKIGYFNTEVLRLAQVALGVNPKKLQLCMLLFAWYTEVIFPTHPFSHRGQEPGVRWELWWPTLCIPLCLHGEDLLLLHLRWTFRWAAVVLYNLRLSERPAVLFLHWKEWWDSGT